MKQLMERAAKALPLGRVGKPEGIAAAVFYIASQVSHRTFPTRSSGTPLVRQKSQEISASTENILSEVENINIENWLQHKKL
jgi:hypothetical protein